MAKKKRKQRGDTMQDVTQKPLTSEAEEAVETMEAVSYTHLDVYKRQPLRWAVTTAVRTSPSASSRAEARRASYSCFMLTAALRLSSASP